MRTLAEQIGGKCKHFNGLGSQSECCKAGVNYSTVKSADKSLKGLALYPCFREGEALPCEKRHFLTPEEVAAEVAERHEAWERTKLAMQAAMDDARKHGYKRGNGGRGFVPCPVCKTGDLHYSVASYNGHMHGRCTTKECVWWMQ